MIHTVQLLPKLVVKTMEEEKMFNLRENGEYEVIIIFSLAKVFFRFIH